MYETRADAEISRTNVCRRPALLHNPALAALAASAANRPRDSEARAEPPSQSVTPPPPPPAVNALVSNGMGPTGLLKSSRGIQYTHITGLMDPADFDVLRLSLFISAGKPGTASSAKPATAQVSQDHCPAKTPTKARPTSW